MDKAAIFAVILKRNALRREARLPALDMAAEYRHAVAQAERAALRAICDEHRDLFDEMLADLFDEMLATVTQELRAKRHNPLFGNCMGSRIVIRKIALERFYAVLERRGFKKPVGAMHNAVTYGESREPGG